MSEHGKHAQHGPARRTRRRAWAAGALTAGAALLLSACTSATGSGPAQTPAADNTGASQQSTGSSPAPSTSAASTSKAPDPIVFTAAPAAKTAVNPTTPITLAVTHGTLRTVALLNPEGKRVAGTLSPDKTSWRADEVLGYGKTYRFSATATDSSGEVTRTYKHAFTTLTPANMTMPYFNTVYGSTLQNGGKYGVGMIPVVNFDEPITREAVAERALQVTTTPHVDGSWYWVNDHQLHWRPKNFYTPGTTVKITAKVYGVEVGDGLYGQSDKSVEFRIGRKQITVANDIVPKVNKVRTFRDGKLIHTMNTSMGKHGGEMVNGKYINFYTLDGTYTVLGFENPASMCSDSYGLPANAPGGYKCEDIPWSTKISTDGIYLHELDSTQWYQDHGYDVSHGCLNLTGPNAQWFFTHSLIGDPVIVNGAKGAPELQLWQGGDWTMSWSQWKKGSAL